eukprot:scaffold897_cov402-Prasinococcus_capsulatus_cf.AAC.32
MRSVVPGGGPPPDWRRRAPAHDGTGRAGRLRGEGRPRGGRRSVGAGPAPALGGAAAAEVRARRRVGLVRRPPARARSARAGHAEHATHGAAATGASAGRATRELARRGGVATGAESPDSPG